jgi:hypothetical protein
MDLKDKLVGIRNALFGSAGEKCQHVAEENVSTRPTRCSGLLATRQIG